MADGKRKASLPPEEWDFRSVREEELMTVCLYEYTRSSDALRTKFEAWHAQTLDLHGLAEMDHDAETASLREKLERIPNRTNAQLIELAFDKEVRNTQPEAACLLLQYFLSFLPIGLSSESDPAIAMRFPDFARSWEQMRCDFGEEYLQVRLLPPSSKSQDLYIFTPGYWRVPLSDTKLYS